MSRTTVPDCRHDADRHPLLDCGHTADTFVGRVCTHLLDSRGEDPDFIKVFTGQGTTYRLTCAACADLSFDTVRWRSACNACFLLLEEDDLWEGVRGAPQVREEPAPLQFVHRQFAALDEALRTLQPVTGASGSVWLGITESGALVELTFGTSGSVTRQDIVRLTASEVDITKPLRLACSAEGRFIGIGEAGSDQSVVYDRACRHFTIRVTRDPYGRPSSFAMAFVKQDERTLLIHKSAWNRLDMSDPETGQCLTQRSSLVWLPGAPYQPHDSGYHYMDLAVAPDQDFVATDGMVAGEAGVPIVWSSRLWREENAWECEDGLTRRDLIQRWYFWNAPLCWIDNRTLAVWGYGTDDQWILPAVCLYDVISGDLRNWFPGPEVGVKHPVPSWATSPATRATGWNIDGALFFDRYLFATSKHHGISVWNSATSARLHQDASFAPIAYHPATQEFLTILPDGNLQLSRLTDVAAENATVPTAKDTAP